MSEFVIRNLIYQSTFILLLVPVVGCDRASIQSGSNPPSEIAQPKIETFEDVIRAKLPTAKMVTIVDRAKPAGPDYFGDFQPPIANTFRFEFTSSTFEIVSNDSQPLPEILVQMIFQRGNPISLLYESTYPVKQITGRWKISAENQLLLMDVQVDDATVYSEMPYVTLDLYHTSPETIFISGAGNAEVRFEVDPTIGR